MTIGRQGQRLAIPGSLWTLLAAVCLAWTVAGTSFAATEPDEPSPTALSAAERYLLEFEALMERADGAPFELNYDANEAMRRVAELYKKYPDHPVVQEMVARVRICLLASRGEVFEITPPMLAYREADQTIMARLVEQAGADWESLLAELAADDMMIQPAFPAPDSAEVPVDEVIGRRVVIEGVRYPDNQFMESGRDLLFAGDGQQGYYYLDLSGRSWRTAYGALRRFRSFVTDELPQPWTVVGEIKGIDLVVPQAGLEKTMAAQYGWVVEPIAIYVPDRTVAWRAGEGENEGAFSGEEELAAMRAEFYTVTEVPEDAEHMELVRIYATAIKERNWDLYVEALDPYWTSTPRAEERLRYYWDINQRLYRELFVHIEPRAVIQDIVIQGERFSEFDDIFLTEEDKEEIAARSEPLIEQVTIEALRYNERGVQESPPSWIQLRRYDNGRWYINTPQPF